MVNAHEKAEITSACRRMAGMGTLVRTRHPDTTESRIARDELAIDSVVGILES